MLRPAAAVEIGRRGGGGEALHARADRHRDHVLLQPLVVADAGIAAGRQHVDEAVLGDHLQPDVRDRRRGTAARCAGSTSRAALTGTLSRSVPAGRSRKPLTTSSAASTSLSAGPSRSSRRCAGLGRRDAARGAVEQPDAELRLQPAHRLAEPGGAAAARARAVAKAAGARHRHEGVQIAQVGLHCSLSPHSLCGLCPIIAQIGKRLSAASSSKETDHDQHRQIRHLHPRRPHREAARLRRHAARRARRVRPAEGSRRGARRAARGGRAAASITSTPATSTARTSPTSSSARRCIPIPTISSSSPRSARGAARTRSWLPAFSPRGTDAGGARQPAQSRPRRARRRQPAHHVRHPRPGRRLDRGAADRRWPSCSGRAWCAISG